MSQSFINIMEIQVAMQCNYFLIFYRMVNPVLNGGFRIIFMLVLSESTLNSYFLMLHLCDIDVRRIIQLIHTEESASYNFIHGPLPEQIQTHLFIHVVHCTFPNFFDRRKL